ncbi:MAG: hypothetical protein ACFFAO_21165 [Candidatus Hermodarchaeota archaeon]
MEETKERLIKNSQIALDLIRDKLIENGYEERKMNKIVTPYAKVDITFEKDGIFLKMEMFTFED